MRRLLRRIGAIGVRPDLSRIDAKHVALTNQTAFGMSLLALAGLGSPAYWQVPEVAACALGQGLLYPLVLALNHLGRPLAARLTFGAVGLAGVTLNAVFLGAASETAHFLAIVALAAWLLYRRDEWRWPALVSGASLATLLVLTLLADQLPSPLPGPVLRQVVVSNRILLFAVLLVFGVVAFLQTNEAEAWLDVERRKSDALLRNILPARIADELKTRQGAIAERFDEATVLFADIVNFTVLAERVQAADLVQLLDEIFRAFDQLADQHGLEKIKTIGDAYMAAAGIPEPRPDHLQAVLAMALAMPAALKAIPGAEGLEVRVGVHTGPVVAGVIGTRKFAYDLWGDTVNTASRMESHGLPGRVHVSEAVYQRVGSDFAFEARGRIAVKGKGELQTYFVVGRRA